MIPIWMLCEVLRGKQHDAYNASSSKMCLLMYYFRLIYSFKMYFNIILQSKLEYFK
jgi:hypothetical protein